MYNITLLQVQQFCDNLWLIRISTLKLTDETKRVLNVYVLKPMFLVMIVNDQLIFIIFIRWNFCPDDLKLTHNHCPWIISIY